MQLHSKVLVANVLGMLAIFIGLGSVSGDTNDPPATEVLATQPQAPRWQPGQLYPTGGGAPWLRQQLTLGEQDLVDKPDPTMPGTANTRLLDATSYQATHAAAGLAAARLGLVGLQEIGVVP